MERRGAYVGVRREGLPEADTQRKSRCRLCGEGREEHAGGGPKSQGELSRCEELKGGTQRTDNKHCKGRCEEPRNGGRSSLTRLFWADTMESSILKRQIGRLDCVRTGVCELVLKKSPAKCLFFHDT